MPCRYLISHLGDSAAILCTAHGNYEGGSDAQPPENTLATGSDARAEVAAASGRPTAEATEPHSSRAVLLTRDHSPARADEAARISAAGGSIMTTPGTSSFTSVRPKTPCIDPGWG